MEKYYFLFEIMSEVKFVSKQGPILVTPFHNCPLFLRRRDGGTSLFMCGRDSKVTVTEIMTTNKRFVFCVAFGVVRACLLAPIYVF